jgi:hypothetical protein
MSHINLSNEWKLALNIFFEFGWRAFLLRLCVVVISLKLNSYESAIHHFKTGAMKFFLLTCAFLTYTIFMLIFFPTERGVKRQKTIERLRKRKSASEVCHPK